MSRVAEFLRRRSREEVSRLSPGERIDLALRLGDFDLDLLGAARTLSPAAARPGRSFVALVSSVGAPREAPVAMGLWA